MRQRGEFFAKETSQRQLLGGTCLFVIGRGIVITQRREIVDLITGFLQLAFEEEVGAGKAGVLGAKRKDRFVHNTHAEHAGQGIAFLFHCNIKCGGVAGAIDLGIGRYGDVGRRWVDEDQAAVADNFTPVVHHIGVEFQRPQQTAVQINRGLG